LQLVALNQLSGETKTWYPSKDSWTQKDTTDDFCYDTGLPNSPKDKTEKLREGDDEGYRKTVSSGLKK
jgi:hypothetical protein